ncbi:MAG: hypothetical protein J07HN6_01887 [Halonotius sp. J07HN6]|nr:MAG: hypothetical protein J07HN6_01887 [Halonotius sp. J07HN6]
MIGFWEAFFGVVFILVMLWAVHRLSVIGRATLALRSTSTDVGTTFTDGQQIAVTGQVVVDEPAVAADRLFNPTDGAVGAYIWHAWRPDTGSNTYDFDRGELRGARTTFAAGIETGELGVTTAGQRLTIDVDWLRELYDTESLAGLDVGNPMSNASLPPFLTRYLWDSNYISLETAIGDCPATQLRDIVNLHIDDVTTERYNIEARGITAGQRLFILGELRERNDEYTIVGTGQTPLLISDTGRSGLVSQLRWRALKYTLALAGAAGLIELFIL